MDAMAFGVGAVLVGLVAWDLFQTVVVPRPSPGQFRIARYVIRGSWWAVKRAGRRLGGRWRDAIFGLFGPGSAILLLGVWLATLILGFGLMLFALRDELSPVPDNLGTAVYFAASSLLTIGYGDVVAQGTASRVLVILAAAGGLGAVALVVTFLFSLYGSYQRREIAVVTLQAASGAPPSAVGLLETYAALDVRDRLNPLFREWEAWSAEVLDSHVAYPILGYFRSSHDNLSWISALGTILDAASLVVTTIEGLPRGDAELCRRAGSHLVEDLSNLGFREGGADWLTRDDFDIVCDRLERAGYRLASRAEAWGRFEAARLAYAPRLEAMARYWAVAASSWLGTMEGLRSLAHPEPAERDRVAREDEPIYL
ncbi:MAG TPA: potassium channel family protein [Candidatus Limnocylindrales bacterium]|nr:potassium channel family protein [Candidatus Limnocylindrales bacterium]